MTPPPPGDEPRASQTATHFLYDYNTDAFIGPATADQISFSEATLTWGGDGMIHIDAKGRICAFGYHVTPGPDIRQVFTQPVITPAAAAPPPPSPGGDRRSRRERLAAR